ncbi:hypothetical protein CC78DRAFT_585086 [Lojkania enalia]|uniref:Uncharacterized protein n=1 Tax=Lojkania enalia TaxID=147567 RepID=A0A9P4K080_9PLEO|nr:hypothetical protein CC78DRAFT_585086 [Didymosphaeria enalia]
MSNQIYTGFWVDRSRHPVLGATWTLSVDRATLLASFLSFIVTTIIVNSLFNIVVFFLYFVRPIRKTENYSSEDVALAKPGICGFLPVDPTVDSLNSLSSRQELYETIDARRYATEKYSKEPARFTTSSPFPVDALPFEIIHNTSCPFDESMCLLGANSAITFDTWFLDSHSHLGINAPPEARVEYRWCSTCTVLNVTARAQVFDDTTYEGKPISSKEPLVEVDLGGQPPFNKNHTFLYRINALDPSGYEVKYVSIVPRLLNVWDPIQPLYVPNASTTLVLIAPNNVAYEQKVFDPVFQATTAGSDPEAWFSDYRFQVIACVDRR